MRVVKVKHVKVPVVQWSNRLLNKPELAHQMVKVVLVAVVELPSVASSKGVPV